MPVRAAATHFYILLGFHPRKGLAKKDFDCARALTSRDVSP